MTDDMEGGLPTGAVGANQQPSSGAGDSEPSAASAGSDLQSLVKRMEKLERSGQSAKDRAIADLQKQIKSLFERLEQGDDFTTSAAPAPAVAGTQQAGAQFDPQAIVTSLGLDPAGPEVTALLREGADDPVGFTLKAAQVALGKQSVKPNPAAVMQTSGPVAPAGDNIDQLSAQIEALMSQPSKNAREIAKLEDKLVKALRGN